MTRMIQHAPDSIGTVLRSGKNKRSIFIGLQESQEQIGLIGMRGMMHRLGHAVSGCRGWCNHDADRVVDTGLNQPGEIRRERSRKEQGLPLLR